MPASNTWTTAFSTGGFFYLCKATIYQMRAISLLSLLFLTLLVEGQEVRNFIFGHSLINHEFEVEPPVPSQETSVPHWLYQLATHAGKEYAASGQYGFLPQHRNVPPIAQWGFDIVPFAWDSDNVPFADADFTDILITPGNFIQWQPPTENYFNETFSPIEATTDIIAWSLEQEPGMDIYLYENWPDMAPFLGSGIPPTESEWQAYNDYLQGDFHQWNLDYRNGVQATFPDDCVKMIPVGPAISDVLLSEPFASIPFDDLYEDDAPHGRPTLYFLAAIATYMAYYEERPPLDYDPEQIIHSIVRDNYELAVDIIWQRLVTEGEVFCTQPTAVDDASLININVVDNGPSLLIADLPSEAQSVALVSIDGRIISTSVINDHTAIVTKTNHHSLGIIVVYDQQGHVIFTTKISL